MDDRKRWRNRVIGYIQDHPEEFYAEHYSANVVPLGNSYRLNPCPLCGHNDCATVGEAVNCFSCGWKGSHLSAYYEYVKEVLNEPFSTATKNLEKFTGEKFPIGSNPEEYEAEVVKQNILRSAEEFYHEQLIKGRQVYTYSDKPMTPLDYLLKIRLRKMETIEDFRIGFSTNYLELHKLLLSRGYTKEQIKSSRAWVPEGVFVFFYKDPDTKDIVRINTKNPFGVTFKQKSKTGEYDGEERVIQGYSVGDKHIMTTPRFDFKKPFVLVEGEHDLASVYENGAKNAACLGGNLGDDQLVAELERAEATIYCAFDNDEAGIKYLARCNELLPDKDLRKMGFNEQYNDIDDYYRFPESVPIETLMKESKQIETQEYRIINEDNVWMILNRHRKLEFIIEKSDKGQMVGTVNLYVDGELIDRETEKDLTRCKANKKPFNFYLQDAMNEHFNSGIWDKGAEELSEIYWFSSKKTDIIKCLATLVYESKQKEDLINMIKIKIKNSDVVDSILKESNDIQNQKMSKELINIPRIRTSQYFNLRNNDAYFYFVQQKMDGDTPRRLPYLLRNDKGTIRLDLLRRKDPQCMLLVDNKYELPYEVDSVVSDTTECSLRQDMAEKYIEGRINPNDYKANTLAEKLFKLYKGFYYTRDPNTYKILVLYTLMTYYYELFHSVPYLFINGEKGSGKSVLAGVLYLFCFNAKMATDISDASLFRITSLEGGTMILDEMEGLTSRKKGVDSTMGSVLKGGYKRLSNVYRADMESKTVTEKFDSYGPKIIINILGLDDIIEDRCIKIGAYHPPIGMTQKFKDPRHFIQEKMDEVREITSLCCLSALDHFKDVAAIRDESYFKSGSARLTEILTPILVMAKLVDKHAGNDAKEWEKSVRDYYEKHVRSDKEESYASTPEGIVKESVLQVARELWGLVPQHDKEYTVPQGHKYTEPIEFNKKEGWFEMDAIHFKCFIEEHNVGEPSYIKIIYKWIRTAFDIDAKDKRRVVAKLEDEDLIHEFKGNKRPRVTKFRFYFRDLIPEIGSEFLDEGPHTDLPAVASSGRSTEDGIFF